MPTLTKRQHIRTPELFLGAPTMVLAVISFATVIYYSYKLAISPTYAYQGLAYRPPDAVNNGIALAATTVVALALPRRILRTSDFIFWMLFVIAAAPAILISQYSPVLSSNDATVMGLNIAGTFLMIRILTTARPRGIIPRRTMPNGHFWLLLGAVSVFIYTYLVLFVGLKFQLLSLTDVYDVRSGFVSAASSAPLLAYLLPIQHNIINPIYIARGVYSKRLMPILVGGGGQVLIYITAGYKSVLFSTLAIFAAALLFRSAQRLPAYRILVAVTLGALFALVVDKLLGSIVASSLFVRRFLIVPGILTAAYVAVFKDKPKTNFSDSILPFLNSPYLENPTHIVGAIFVHNAGTAANVSLFGHGYLNYGYLGMYIEGIVLVVLLWFVDDATRGIPVPVSSLIFVMPTFALSSSSVFTTMLTHGFVAAILISAVMPRRGWARVAKRRWDREGAPLLHHINRSGPAKPSHQQEQRDHMSRATATHGLRSGRALLVRSRRPNLPS